MPGALTLPLWCSNSDCLVLSLFPCHLFVDAVHGAFAQCTPSVCPASQSMFRPSIPILTPGMPSLGYPFHNCKSTNQSRTIGRSGGEGVVETIVPSLGIIHCSLGHYNKCPNPIALGKVRKSLADTCPQTVGGGTVTVERSLSVLAWLGSHRFQFSTVRHPASRL